MTNEIKLPNYNITEQDAHFYNDVKYVTVSLGRERNQVLTKFQSDILSLDVVNIRYRFQKEYQEILYSIKNELHNQMSSTNVNDLLQLVKQIYSEIEDGYQQLVKLDNISHHMKEHYHLTFYTIGNLIKFINLSMQIDINSKPTAAWFVEANYDAIIEMIDLAQTKVEDYIKSKKRLGKVWKEEIFIKENLSLIERFQTVKMGGFRFLHSFYWKQKKQFRSLFIEDIELLNEQEYEVLYNNLLIYHECKEWLENENSKVQSLLGENYIKEDTSFPSLRREYDSIYRFIQMFSIELPMSFIKELLHDNGVRKFYDLIRSLIKQENIKSLNKLENIPFPKSYQLMELSATEAFELFTKLKDNYQLLINDLEFILSLVYKKVDGLTMDELRKYFQQIERIKQKEEWLLTNQEKIEDTFGGHYRKNLTDWEEVRQYLASVKETKGYGFSLYYEAVKPQVEKGHELTNEHIWEVCETILLAEHPIKEEIFQKRVVKLLDQKRITPKLKESINSYLENYLKDGFVLKDGVLQKEDITEYNLRIYLPEDGKREIESIPECELCAGVLSIIRVKREITLDSISKIMAEQLGYPRRTKMFNSAVGEIVKKLKQESKIVRHSGGWRLCK
ncbi:hypothetical protein [Lachnoclostridium phytofermentans]|uniref:Uncharacterized protein n=1 Tax=Lachnoclostridium phytofermentans (strain ATCC 700394 / DSM 18823 / ISDg) TaxID=357809 RepID=A9KHJ5_LACP7|nr:hypothetical protein [Lachnoclostridium phytofermentans]ABX42280.1 hypothetical protein Cphy_1911 [Lachnoclostridium phytofermentans ISDg]